MEERSAFAFRILVVALVLGVIGDWLLRSTPWGINFPLWVTLVGICAAGLVRKSPVTLSRAALWMSLPIALFSFCFFWRDADELKVANFTAVFIALGVLALRAHKGRIAVAGITDYTFRVIGMWFMFTADFAELLTKDLQFKEDSRNAQRLKAVVRGLLLATPLLLIFGGLFASADAVFSQWVQHAFTFDAADSAQDIITFAALALIVGGLFRRLFIGGHRPDKIGPPRPLAEATAKGQDPSASLRSARDQKSIGIGTIELATVFALLDALFIAFVVIQFRYLFGGTDHVAKVAGLTFAEYARNGFFELTAAAALTLPVILGAHALIPRESRRGPAVFSALGAILAVCVLVVLVSAIQRMRIYVWTFGLSELRVFTTAFMVWIALTFVWLIATVLRHRRDRFAFGALAAGYVVILGLNFANPDALIASVNMDPHKNVDVAYLSELSLDGAPVVSARLGALRPLDREKLRTDLKKRWGAEVKRRDWRSLNIARLAYLRKSML